MRSRDDSPHLVTTREADRRPTHAAGDGEVPSWWSALDRRRLAVALGSTFVAVPVVVFDNLPQHRSAQAEAEEVAVVAEAPTTLPPSSTTVTVESTTTTTAATAAPTTTTTTAPPRSTTTTTAAPTTTTAPPATTTTTAPPPTTAPPAPAPAPPPPPPPAPANQQSGKASWYRYRAGECAHRTLPRGTVVTVTNVANGATATCTVTDRGPYTGGRIIDLDDDTFAQLAPLSAGVIDVSITW